MLKEEGFIDWFVSNGGLKTTAKSYLSTVRLFQKCGMTDHDICKLTNQVLVKRLIRKRGEISQNSVSKYKTILTAYREYITQCSENEMQKRMDFLHWGVKDRRLSRSTVLYYYSVVNNFLSSGFTAENLCTLEPYVIVDEYLSGRRVTATIKNKMRCAVRVFRDYYTQNEGWCCQ